MQTTDFFFDENCVSPIVILLGCSSFSAQNDLLTEFDKRRLFSLLSADKLKFLCAHFKPEFKTNYLISDDNHVPQKTYVQSFK